MQYNNFDDVEYQNKLKEYQKNIEKLSYNESIRKEQHESTRIIFNREATPVSIYQNVMNNTTFIYKNRVLSEKSRDISALKGIRVKKNVATAIIWIGVLITAISAYILFFHGRENLELSMRRILAVVMMSGAPVFFMIGLIILKCNSRKYMVGYLPVLYPFGSHVEINRLTNGQMVILRYATRKKTCETYISALNPDDTIWDQQLTGFFKDYFYRSRIPTYISYMYIIDSIKSCKKTKGGIMIESSGRYYGRRGACEGKDTVYFDVFAEAYVSYRKEEIPAIFTNMEQLEASLMNYGYYEEERDRFYPL